MRIFFFITLIVTKCLLAADLGNEIQASASTEGQIKFVISELERCPSWIYFRRDEKEFSAGVVRLYLELAKFDTEIVRSALVSLSTGNDPSIGTQKYIGTTAKLFLLTRVLFRPPKLFPFDEVNYECSAPPPADGKVDLRWPIEEDNAGNLELDCVFPLFLFNGPRYDAVKEFDFFRKHFPRRVKVGVKR